MNHQPQPPEARLIDVEAVAVRLAVSTRTVRRLADSARMPRPFKLGHLIRWSEPELEKWISEGCPNLRQMRRSGRA